MPTTRTHAQTDLLGKEGPAIRLAWLVALVAVGIAAISWLDAGTLHTYGPTVAATVIGSEVSAVIASAAVYALFIAYEQNRTLAELLERMIDRQEMAPTPVGSASPKAERPSVPLDVNPLDRAPPLTPPPSPK
jgi:hypothetical protein